MSEGETGAAPRQLEYVGFWKRLVAFLIDVFIIIVVTAPTLWAIYGRGYFDPDRRGFAGFWDFIISLVLPAVAAILFWKYRGATPGKMAISARIVDAKTGAAPSTGKCVTRYFAYLVSMLTLGLGFLWIAIDRRKQGFHDKIANTLVVTNND